MHNRFPRLRLAGGCRPRKRIGKPAARLGHPLGTERRQKPGLQKMSGGSQALGRPPPGAPSPSPMKRWRQGEEAIGPLPCACPADRASGPGGDIGKILSWLPVSGADREVEAETHLVQKPQFPAEVGQRPDRVFPDHIQKRHAWRRTARRGAPAPGRAKPRSAQTDPKGPRGPAGRPLPAPRGISGVRPEMCRYVRRAARARPRPTGRRAGAWGRSSGWWRPGPRRHGARGPG